MLQLECRLGNPALIRRIILYAFWHILKFLRIQQPIRLIIQPRLNGDLASS